jgi:predicted ribosomally synthesized peptide with nif11-like leader
MSVENVEAFRQKLSGDAGLQSKVRESLASGWGGVIALGSENGFEFSAADLDRVFGETQRAELTDFELELVVGGTARILQKCA